MRPTDETNDKRQIKRRFQEQMKASSLESSRAHTRVKSFLKNHNKSVFEKKYKITLVNILEKMIYEDVGANLSALAEIVKGINPDETVDHSR